MTIATNNVIAKIAAVVAGLGLVAMSFAYAAPAAKADTTSDLQAQISALMAQIAALQAQAGGSAAAGTAVQFNMDLTIGSKGADVTALQQWLVSKGFLQMPANTSYGYFGAVTKAAVASWQASAGITPAAGYFGPKSRAVANAAAGTTGGTTGGTTSTVGLTGTGRFTNVSSIGDTESDLDVGDSATAVVGLSADATDGDVAIQRVDVTFTVGTTNAGSSANLNKYISSAAIYLDGKKLGSMDATAGDKDGRVWTLRFASLNGVVKKGQTGDLYVKVTPVTSIGTNEDGEDIAVEIAVDGLRAVGADGISETYITSSTNVENTFSVSTLTEGTLTTASASENPKASQVAVSSSTTTGVKLLTFTMKAKNQDLTITDLPVQLTTSDTLTDVVSSVKLMKGDTVLKSKTVASGTATTTFTDVNIDLAKDSTATYSIVVDLKGDSAYADGTTLSASLKTYGWDVSDADGASVTPSSNVTGNSMTLTATGISVVKGAITTSTTVGLASAGDTTQYTIPFTVTAGDDDVYVGYTAAQATTYATTTSSTVGATGTATASFSASDSVSGDSAGTAYLITAGSTRSFTLNVSYTATSTGYTGVVLTGVKYGATTALGSTYTSNLDTFKTTDVFMKVR